MLRLLQMDYQDLAACEGCKSPGRWLNLSENYLSENLSENYLGYRLEEPPLDKPRRLFGYGWGNEFNLPCQDTERQQDWNLRQRKETGAYCYKKPFLQIQGDSMELFAFISPTHRAGFVAEHWAPSLAARPKWGFHNSTNNLAKIEEMWV